MEKKKADAFVLGHVWMSDVEECSYEDRKDRDEKFIRP